MDAGARHAADHSTWEVVSTVDAPMARLEALAERHIRLGASRVTYYLDNPNGEAPFENPATRFIRCDDDYWNGRRPAEHQHRQIHNAAHAYREAIADWLLHIDSDEFVALDRRAISVGAALASLSHLDVARMSVCERIFLRGAADPSPDRLSGFYRKSAPRDQAKALRRYYGGAARRLVNGLMGHSVGKCFFRTGVRGLRPGIHNARTIGDGRTPGEAPGLILMHMFVDCEDEFRQKVRRRTRGLHADPARKFGDATKRLARDLAGDEGAETTTFPDLFKLQAWKMFRAVCRRRVFYFRG